MNDKERDKAFKAERKLRAREKTRIQRDTSKEVRSLLNTALADIRNIVAAAPSDYQLWILPQIERSIVQALNEAGGSAVATLSTAATESATAGVALVDAPLTAGGGPAIGNVIGQFAPIDMRQLNAMRTFMTGRMKDITTTAANAVNRELGLVAIGGQTSGDAVTRIAAHLKSGRDRAITVIRTELGRAFSVATQERQTQAQKILPGLQKQWRRSGKVHSRLSHDSADGQIVDVDKPFSVGGVKLMHPRDPAAPPKHTINCGCDSLPYMAHWLVANPGKKPITIEEMARNPNLALLADRVPASSLPR